MQQLVNQPANQNPYDNWASQNPYNQYNQPRQNQQLVNSSRVWVQGEVAGKAYMVRNNTEQVLWDTDEPVIYIKTVDAMGRPSMVILDYVIREPQPEYDQNKETEALKSEIAELKGMVKQLMDQNNKNNYKSNYKKNNGGNET